MHIHAIYINSKRGGAGRRVRCEEGADCMSQSMTIISLLGQPGMDEVRRMDIVMSEAVDAS
jgi:hypothetical protein